MVESSLTGVATAFVSLGIGLGAGIKLIVPLFKRNGNNGNGHNHKTMDYVTKDWCERTHASEEKRHDELMSQLGAIWKKLDNVDIRTAHIEGALKQMGNLTVNQQE
jgi:hypothetical protein